MSAFKSGLDYRTIREGYAKRGGSPFTFKRDTYPTVSRTPICTTCKAVYEDGKWVKECTNKCKG